METRAEAINSPGSTGRGNDRYVALSPDGTRGAVRDAHTNSAGDLWSLDFARGVRTRFTFRQSLGSWPVWSPDGNLIAFAAGNDLGNVNK